MGQYSNRCVPTGVDSGLFAKKEFLLSCIVQCCRECDRRDEHLQRSLPMASTSSVSAHLQVTVPTLIQAAEENRTEVLMNERRKGYQKGWHRFLVGTILSSSGVRSDGTNNFVNP